MPYRDDQASLEARREELRADLADAERRVEDLSGAVEEQERARKELASVEKRLRRAGPRLPVLEDIRIAAPCSARWEDMVGDERVRFCTPCQKDVYNLSAMPREEAEGLLAQHEGSLCVRLYKRADGTVISNDCSVGVRRRRVRRAVALVAGSGALAALAGGGLTTVQGDMARHQPMQGLTGTPVTATPVMGGAGVDLPLPPEVTVQPPKATAPTPVTPAPPTKGKVRPTLGQL